MVPTITAEMRQSLELADGAPIDVIDPVTQKEYLLIERELYHEIVRERLLDMGRVVPFDPEEIKRQGREILARQRMRPES